MPHRITRYAAPFVLSLALLHLAVLTGCASMSRMSEDMREVQTIEQHDLSKQEAYDRLMRWVAQTYTSANDVVQRSDEETGTIIVKGAERISRAGLETFAVRYGMTIDVRDGKVRFTQRVGQTMEEGTSKVTQRSAEIMHQRFADMRASAMAALAAEDNF